MEDKFYQMYEVAFACFNKAYAPYSKFKVGACVRMKNGDLIGGCNVENASYGLCICAERNALFQAVAKGYKKDDIDCLLVLTDTVRAGSPCGACRQVMSELMDQDAIVYLTNIGRMDGNKIIRDTKIMSVKELLPYAFEQSDLDV